MRFLRNKRLLGVGALGGLVALMLLVVLPAVASTANDFVAPPSTGDHVMPRDLAIGGTGDCANLFSGLGSYSEYDNVNPKTATNLASGNHDGATFTLNLSGSSKSQTLDVSASGAEILGIGIKGGTQSTAYNYVSGPYVTSSPPYTALPGPNPTSVAGDTGLHAPAQNFTIANALGGIVETPTQYYSISQLTVCYTQGSVSGTVYQDSNFSGGFDSGEPTLSGWTIHLYNSLGSLVGTTTSNANGAYRIGTIFDGGNYTVCEVPNPATPLPAGDNAWAQTQPGAGSPTCTGTGEFKNGSVDHHAEAARQRHRRGLRQRRRDQVHDRTVRHRRLPGRHLQADADVRLHPGTTTPGDKPYVSYFVGDPTQSPVPTVERVSFADPWNGGPAYKTLNYEDSAGFQAPTDGNLHLMPWCSSDPRDTSAAGYPDSYTLPLSPPSPASLSGGATSCLISLKITAPAGGAQAGTMVAYVYSSSDSIRSPS